MQVTIHQKGISELNVLATIFRNDKQPLDHFIPT